MEHVFWSLWRNTSYLARMIRLLLRPFSWPFSWGSTLFHRLYDKGYLKSYSSSVKVVSIGNITVGGTGKTPFVLALAEQLEKTLGQVAVISRGYRSAAEEKGAVFQKGDIKSQIAGDEALIMINRLENPLICVGKDRIKALKVAESRDVKVALLDDGFQKRSIHRLIDIVLLDEQEPFGQKAFLPSGFLRDHPSSLKRADFIVVPESFDAQRIEFLRNFTKAPIIYTKASYEIALDKEIPVALFAGIAAPERFLRAMKELGFSVVYAKWLKDHASLTEDLLQKIWQEAKSKGAKALVCTEKDWVKMPASLDIPVTFLRMKTNIEPVMGQQLLDKILT